MPRKDSETQIGSTRYRVRQLGASTGGELIFRVGMPILALIGSSLGKGGPKLSVESMQSLVKSLSPADLNWTIVHFRETSQVWIVDEAAGPDANGNPIGRWLPLGPLYDEHFAGSYRAWLEWLVFAAEANFGDFFGGSLAGSPAGEKASSPSTSPTGASGTSGASSSAPG